MPFSGPMVIKNKAINTHGTLKENMAWQPEQLSYIGFFLMPWRSYITPVYSESVFPFVTVACFNCQLWITSRLNGVHHWISNNKPFFFFKINAYAKKKGLVNARPLQSTPKSKPYTVTAFDAIYWRKGTLAQTSNRSKLCVLARILYGFRSTGTGGSLQI